MRDPLLSICIPTRNRTDIVIRTLDSIFVSNVSLSEYEVVIYDSSDDDQLDEIINKRYSQSNLKYVKGENLGFLNLIEVLKKGSGSLLKLHNDYSVFEAQSLDLLMRVVKNTLKEKPVIFFSNGSLNMKRVCRYDSFDDFMYNISYYSSWSTSFSIWKDDLIKNADISLEPMFPHTSLLFSLSEKNNYIVDDSLYFKNQKLEKKGGYNLFETFSVCYLRMLDGLLRQNKITKKTFNYIKKDLFKNFLVVWYCNTILSENSYSFVLTDIKRSISVYYSVACYPLLIALAYLYLLMSKAKAMLKWMNGKK